MMAITLSHWIENVIEGNFWKDQIKNHLVIKFGFLIIDKGGDKVMCSAEIYHRKLIGLPSSHHQNTSLYLYR